MNWPGETDDSATENQVQELEEIFSKRFHYRTIRIKVNSLRNPQHELYDHVARFIHDHDGENRLLIVYCNGNAVYDNERRTLLIAGNRDWSTNEVIWNQVHDILWEEQVQSDVLTILDTRFTSNLAQSSGLLNETGGISAKLGSSTHQQQNTSSPAENVRKVEMLAPSIFQQISQTSESMSFTRVLIDALDTLWKQQQNVAFSTLQLKQTINMDKRYRSDTPSILWLRSPCEKDRHIQLGPLLGPLHKSDPGITSNADSQEELVKGFQERMRLQTPLNADAKARAEGKEEEEADPAAESEARAQQKSSDGSRPDLGEGTEPLLQHDDENDTTYESALSDTESTWSKDFSNSSSSSLEEIQEISHSAANKLTEILWQDPYISDLYRVATERLSKDVFYKSHDALLKTFFGGLRSETSTKSQLASIRILRHSTRREQVTQCLYTLAGPKQDMDTLHARQNFLDQTEHRNELLERFLLSQADPQRTTIVHENVQAPPDEGDSSDSEVEEAMSLEELDSVISFLTRGAAFAVLKANLYGLAYPEKAIKEILWSTRLYELLRPIGLTGVLRSTFRIEALESLLSRQFKRVAVGEYAWIRELAATGYTTQEVAQLLLEDATHSPWIHFRPRGMPKNLLPQFQFHIVDCVHTVHHDLGTNTSLAHNEPLDIKIQHRQSCSISEDVRETIQGLCGLAGVLPEDVETDPGECIVTFLEEHTVAEVTYRSEREGAARVLGRCLRTLDRLLAAFCLSQNETICCDRFTFMTHGALPKLWLEDEVDPIQLLQLRFESVRRLQQVVSECHEKCRELQGFEYNSSGDEIPVNSWKPSRSEYNNMHDAALDVLRPLGVDSFPQRSRWTFDQTLHALALAAQFASLSFMYYIQAHQSPLHPFFLDTAQRAIALFGAYRSHTAPFWIIAHQAQLTCLGDMLRTPVNVFRAFDNHEDDSFSPSQEKYDLQTLPEDLLDTWVDGSLLVPNERKGDIIYHAIYLCGGIIAPVQTSESGLSNTESHGSKMQKFHWSRGSTALECSSLFQLGEEICIGAFVNLNENCVLDEAKCWRSSNPAFEVLGVQDTVWRYDESQFGAQAGQYTVLQFNRTKHKIPGITLKTVILRDIQDDAYQVRNILNDQWGLQVSFCTGVARRVPLGVMMADLLPVVSVTLLQDQRSSGNLVRNDFDSLKAKHSGNVLTWLEDLTDEQRNAAYCLMRRILLTLEPTGVDQEGSALTVAWVYERPPYRCFKISCNDKRHSWMRVLADSGDCATFAYIVTDCLETSSIKCRGPSSHWNNMAPVLETAVLRHNLQPSQPLGPLEHKKSYFFKKMDTLLQVTVEKETAAGDVKLYVTPSMIPSRFRARLYNLERNRAQASRIRERRECDEVGAEAVAILAKS